MLESSDRVSFAVRLSRVHIPVNFVFCTVCCIIIIIILLLTAIQFSLSGSIPYTSTDRTNNIHKRNNTKHSTNNTKHSKYKYTLPKHPHITKLTHTHTHNKIHTYTNPHFTKSTHTHTHLLQNPHIHTPTHYKTV